MENASKALIIAGAILISILLISVGIIIMNAINNPVQQGKNSADSQAIEMFNAKFTSYAGKQKGSVLKGLTSIVNASNAGDSNHQVAIYCPTGITSLANLNPNTEYTVNVLYATKNGNNVTANIPAGVNVAGPTAFTNANTQAGYVYAIQITN